MTNNFSWKGLNLNILITGSYGNDIFNASRIETEGMASGNNQTTTVLAAAGASRASRPTCSGRTTHRGT